MCVCVCVCVCHSVCVYVCMCVCETMVCNAMHAAMYTSHGSSDDPDGGVCCASLCVCGCGVCARVVCVWVRVRS